MGHAARANAKARRKAEQDRKASPEGQAAEQRALDERINQAAGRFATTASQEVAQRLAREHMAPLIAAHAKRDAADLLTIADSYMSQAIDLAVAEGNPGHLVLAYEVQKTADLARATLAAQQPPEPGTPDFERRSADYKAGVKGLAIALAMVYAKVDHAWNLHDKLVQVIEERQKAKNEAPQADLAEAVG